jgi:hypothetical protein
MAEDRCLIHFEKQTTYLNTAENQVGAGIQTGLRIIPSPSSQVHYVRKFGTQYLITDVTDMNDPVDANMTFTIKALDGTTLGSRTGGGAFVDGSTVTAQGCYLEISASGGDVTLPAAYTIDTDVDVAGLSFQTAAETVYDGNTLTLYLADSASTYYDSDLKLGGDRHTPVVNNTRFPFFHPYDAYADAAMGANDGVEIVDNETYSFPYKDTGGNLRYEFDLDTATTYLYSSDGQNPKIKGIIGADIEREITAIFNNANSVFFNENGTNVDTGATGYEDTWHDPYGTVANAITAAAGKGVTNVIYGGTGAANGTINEAIVLNAAYVLEPEYGYAPILTNTSDVVTLSHINAQIHGFNVKGLGADGIKSTVAHQNYIINNTCYDCVDGIKHINGITYTFFNLCYNNSNAGIKEIAGDTSANEFRYNICRNNTNYGITIDITDDQANAEIVMHNLLYNNQDGLHIKLNAIGNDANVVENNTITQNTQYGFYLEADNWAFGTVRDLISYNNTTYDMYKDGVQAVTFTESNYGTNSGWTVGAGNITTDPEFCRILSPYKFGISANSGAYRTDTSSDDMGAHFKLIEINNDNIEINGIQIDGNEQFNNAIYIADTADHIGITIKWCNVFDFQGIQIDPYDDNTDTDWTVSNNLIYNGGNGIKLSYGGNTLEENCFYNNAVFGVWSDYTGQTFNHNVFYLNQYGVYFESNTNAISLKNCIFDQNSLYDIFSEVTLIITYCCITGAYNSNVNITDSSNIIDDPLFINKTSGSEDFNIKTIEAGDTYDSKCKDASDDLTFPDIGAYDIARSTEDEWWQSYQLVVNPENMNMALITKSLRNIEEGLGSKLLYGKSHKRVLPFVWMPNNRMPEIQRKQLEYMSTLIPTRENGLTKEGAKFRIHLQPDTFHYTGTGTVNASALTITDATKSLQRNETKGWWIGIQYETGTATGTITASTKKLQVAPSPAWTNDEWIGYYFYYNDYYYYITDNDADELTLSDPDGTLADVANINWNIEKYFRIASNTATVFTVEDPDSGLVDGSYAYYIDFIECRLSKSGIAYRQLPRFKWTREYSKSGQQIVFEES